MKKMLKLFARDFSEKLGRGIYIKLGVVASFLVLYLLTQVNMAPGTANWTRKYGVNCNTCHTVFPRLNYEGEKFMKNGYQMTGTQDGDEQGKQKVDNRLVIDEIGNFMGVRISFTPVQVKTNTLIEGGETKTSIDIGKPDWIQIFTSGSIFKNIGIFVETEITSSAIKNNWFRVGFHNLFNTAGLANIRVGQLSMLEWHAVTGRLRMIPNVNIQATSGISSSNGKGEDSAPIASALPGIEFYGYKGPLTYSIGAVNGAKLTDPNRDKNFFGSLRFETTSGSMEGSAITFWGMRGVDTDSTPTLHQRNIYWRVSPAFNLRYKDLDLIGGFFYGEDDNWTLVSTNKQTNVFRAIAGQLGYRFSPLFYGVLQYDWVDVNDEIVSARALEFNRVTPSIWVLPRENMRIGLTTRIDVQSPEPGVHPEKLHELVVTLRTMF